MYSVPIRWKSAGESSLTGGRLAPQSTYAWYASLIFTSEARSSADRSVEANHSVSLPISAIAAFSAFLLSAAVCG